MLKQTAPTTPSATDQTAAIRVERHCKVPPALPVAVNSNELLSRSMDASDFGAQARRECGAYPQRSATNEQHRLRPE